MAQAARYIVARHQKKAREEEAKESGCREWGEEGATYACQLEDLSRKILEHGGDIDGGLGADAHLVLRVVLEETLDTAAGELAGWKEDTSAQAR